MSKRSFLTAFVSVAICSFPLLVAAQTSPTPFSEGTGTVAQPDEDLGSPLQFTPPCTKVGQTCTSGANCCTGCCVKTAKEGLVCKRQLDSGKCP